MSHVCMSHVTRSNESCHTRTVGMVHRHQQHVVVALCERTHKGARVRERGWKGEEESAQNRATEWSMRVCIASVLYLWEGGCVIYVYIYIHISISISISVSISMYTNIYMYMYMYLYKCMSVYIYIFIYICMCVGRTQERQRKTGACLCVHDMVASSRVVCARGSLNV